MLFSSFFFLIKCKNLKKENQNYKLDILKYYSEQKKSNNKKNKN